MSEVYNALQAVVALGLSYTCYCRLKKMDSTTLPAIQHAFAVMFTVSLALAFAPWVWSIHATPVSLAFVSAVLLMQAVTATLWRDGLPHCYRSDRGCP
jgi:predicted Kef-type K+ transport protein